MKKYNSLEKQACRLSDINYDPPALEDRLDSIYVKFMSKISNSINHPLRSLCSERPNDNFNLRCRCSLLLFKRTTRFLNCFIGFYKLS